MAILFLGARESAELTHRPCLSIWLADSQSFRLCRCPFQIPFNSLLPCGGSSQSKFAFFASTHRNLFIPRNHRSESHNINRSARICRWMLSSTRDESSMRPSRKSDYDSRNPGWLHVGAAWETTLHPRRTREPEVPFQFMDHKSFQS